MGAAVLLGSPAKRSAPKTASYHPPTAGNAKRVDLHCHSRASSEADEALLSAIQCPESYSEPREVHAQAKRRGMDFVTITDRAYAPPHDDYSYLSRKSRNVKRWAIYAATFCPILRLHSQAFLTLNFL